MYTKRMREKKRIQKRTENKKRTKRKKKLKNKKKAREIRSKIRELWKNYNIFSRNAAQNKNKKQRNKIVEWWGKKNYFYCYEFSFFSFFFFLFLIKFTRQTVAIQTDEDRNFPALENDLSTSCPMVEALISLVKESATITVQTPEARNYRGLDC